MTEEREVITLEFDDKDVECEIMGTFEVDGKEYIALIPDDGTDNVWIYTYVLVNEDPVEFDIIDIEDDAEFEAAVAEFDRIMLGEEA